MAVIESQKNRIPSLDGLRAFSILCVLWGHASGTRGFPLRWSLDGSLGVRIFFVISGFIITWLMIREQKANGAVSLISFYRRRAARILPAYWCYLAVVAVLGYCKIFPLNFADDILQPLTFSLGFWSKKIAWQTAHSWSLCIEEQFYLVWPPIFVLIGKRWRLMAPIVVMIIGPIARCWIWQHPTHSGLNFTILSNADMLAWGCVLAIVRSDYPGLLSRITAWRPPVARLVAIVTIQFAPWYFWSAFAKKFPLLSTTPLSQSAQAAAIAFLIASLIDVRRGVLFRFLNWPMIAWVGLLSYSLYLWQEVFLDATGPHLWNSWPANMLCTFAAAISSYYLIERPFRRLGSVRNAREAVASP